MKNIFKNPIFMFILGALIFGGLGIGVYAISANQISYDSTTVQDAIDALYQINSYQTDYSETEKVVGTWINGKPLYQKTIEFTTSTYDLQELSFEHIQLLNASFYTSNSDVILLDSEYYSANDWARIVIGGTTLIIQKGSSTSIAKTVCTIQYTKTTDPIPNQNNG